MTSTNVSLDLCSRHDNIAMLKEEMSEVVARDGMITASILNSVRLKNIFMKKSRLTGQSVGSSYVLLLVRFVPWFEN